MIQVGRETHETPDGVKGKLCLAGGRNRFGEPNFRAVWGWNRLDWIGGKWEDRNAAGELVREVVELRYVPKYPKCNRWHIERWMPPESYGSPRAWRMETMEIEGRRNVEALGPYPSRGDYEHLMTLESADGRFLQLTEPLAERLAKLIMLGAFRTRNEGYQAIRRREEKAEEDYDNWAWDLLSDTPQYPGLKVTVL